MLLEGFIAVNKLTYWSTTIVVFIVDQKLGIIINTLISKSIKDTT